MSFKRGQVEGALSAVLLGPGSSARDRVDQPIDPKLTFRLKRLLELDRNWGQVNPKRAASGYAFYDAVPGGTGNDVAYSAQRAFNLAVALLLIDFGFKQSEVVERIALLQPQLKLAFERATRTLRTDGARHHRSQIDSATGKALPLIPTLSGQAEQPDTSIFLLVSRVEGSDRIKERPDGTAEAGAPLIDSELCWGHVDLSRHFQGNIDHTLRGVFVIELSELAARLTELLAIQPAAQRGPPTATPSQRRLLGSR